MRKIKAMWILQACYLLLSLLSVLFVFLFIKGVPYVFPIAIILNMAAALCYPMVPICFVIELVSFFQVKLRRRLIGGLLSFVFITVIAVLAYLYGNAHLVGVI